MPWFKLGSSITVLRLLTLQHPAPDSTSVKAVIPLSCSTTSKAPLLSNLIPRGLVRFRATNRATKPGATEGAAYPAVRVDEQEARGEYDEVKEEEEVD
jgi:hypothetical protein